MHKIILLLIPLVLVIGYLISNQENAKPKQNCYCETDQYNCADFESGNEARELYQCCMDKVGYDVHQLDGDNDKRACEW